MNFDPHFIAALVGLIISEIIPIVTKSRYGGIIHAVVALLGKLYSSPADITGLSAQLTDLQAQIGKMQEPVAVAQTPGTPATTTSPQG